MESRTSRGSGLRRLVLGGAVAGLSTLSSCIPLAVGLAGYGLQSNADTQRKIVADRENARMIADATREAGNNRQSNQGEYFTFFNSDVGQQVTVLIKPGEDNIPLGEIYNRRMREINPGYIPPPKKPVVTITTIK